MQNATKLQLLLRVKACTKSQLYVYGTVLISRNSAEILHLSNACAHCIQAFTLKSNGTCSIWLSYCYCSHILSVVNKPLSLRRDFTSFLGIQLLSVHSKQMLPCTVQLGVSCKFCIFDNQQTQTFIVLARLMTHNKNKTNKYTEQCWKLLVI